MSNVMNNENRFAPPRAVVEGATPERADAPALWNPNAAANWCLLFTPMFGAWLQMLNWRALGESARADAAKVWLVLSALVLAFSSLFDLLLPDSVLSALTAPFAFLWLIVWYFASGRPHARWIAERFGADYPRQSWWMPLLWGAGGYALIMVWGAVAGIVVAHLG